MLIRAYVIEDTGGFYIEISVGKQQVFFGRFPTAKDANTALRALKLTKGYF